MRARSLPAVVLLVLVAALAPPAAATRTVDGTATGCVAGDVADAAATLVHPHAEVVAIDQIAGLESALVLEPLIAPGTRRRLVRAGEQWCDMSAFNEAWRAAGRAVGTAEQAGAYARLAAAPYFDDVSVQRVTETAAGAFAVGTHARTNGVTATWEIRLDGEGVRDARWTATGFAVAPFEAEIEGVTALPGLVRRYARDPAGALVAREELVDVAGANPGPFTSVSFPDGFTIEVHASETPAGPNLGLDTGVTLVDYIRIMADAAKENYEDFLGWGFERDWANAPTPYPHGGTPDVGIIYVDSAITAFCLACVWIRDDFQIHMSSQVLLALEALGYRYPGASDRDALTNVVGHEMFHNFQNAYAKPGRNGASAHVAFAEGTARMQETLHDYSHISHQPESLVYAKNANGCNGWDGSDRDAAFAGGPLNGKTYNACYFWLTWQRTHGTDGLQRLLEAMHDHVRVGDATEEGFGAIAQATGQDMLPDLLAFAASTLTGEGYDLPAGDGNDPLDWSAHLELWKPWAIAIGGTADATLRNGGMLAREITHRGRPTLSGEGVLAVVQQDAEGVSSRVLEPGEVLEAPGVDERTWVVAVNPELQASAVTLRYEAAGD